MAVRTSLIIATAVAADSIHTDLTGTAAGIVCTAHIALVGTHAAVAKSGAFPVGTLQRAQTIDTRFAHGTGLTVTTAARNDFVIDADAPVADHARRAEAFHTARAGNALVIDTGLALATVLVGLALKRRAATTCQKQNAGDSEA